VVLISCCNVEDNREFGCELTCLVGKKLKGNPTIDIDPQQPRFTALFQMPIACQRGTCQASNTFNVARFVFNVFLDAPRRHRRPFFSSNRTLYATADYVLKDDSGQRGQQVRYVFDKNNASAASFDPIVARAARRTLAKQGVNIKLQSSLDPTSLEKTLEKHRAVNMSAITKRVPTDKNAGGFKRPKFIARRLRRRKPTTMLSEKNNVHEEKSDMCFEEYELLRDAWFEHLDVSTVPKVTKDRGAASVEDKADKIIKSKVNRRRSGSVLEYEGKYVNPVFNAKLDRVQLPWAVGEAATASERYD
jgi:hypothetical protein